MRCDAKNSVASKRGASALVPLGGVLQIRVHILVSKAVSLKFRFPHVVSFPFMPAI